MASESDRPSPPSDPSAAALVQQAIDGVPTAADRLLLEFGPRLLARIDRRLPADLRSICAPEDILQETCVEAFESVRGFSTPAGQDPADAFFRWLATIAEHQIIDAIRAHRSLKRGGDVRRATGAAQDTATTIVPLIDALSASQDSPSRVAIGREADRAIIAALDSLYPAYREALELRYLLGLSPPEIAVRLGRTEEAVHKLCNRALAALRQSMGDPGRFLSRDQ